MNLLHLIPYFAPAWGFGGVVRAAYGLTTALAARGHTITAITTDAGDGGSRLESRETVVEGVRVIRCRNVCPGLRRFNLSTPAELCRVLGDALKDADVLHLHEFRTVEALMALPLARKMGVPVVLSPHGTLSYEAGRSAIKRGWDALLGQWTAAPIDAVIALTADEAADVRALWQQFGLSLPDGRVIVVPNGVHLDEFATLPPRDVFRARWGIPPDAPLILFLGRLHRRKGAHLLIDALPALPDVWLAVVGPDEGEGVALRTQAASLGVANRVVFTGLLAGGDKLAALSGADVLALPAVGEGLPMVALEALAAGLPVALSDGCHLPEAVEAGAGIRLDPLSGAGIAAALSGLLADGSLRQTMGARGRALVAERFTWATMAVQVEAVYRQTRAPIHLTR